MQFITSLQFERSQRACFFSTSLQKSRRHHWALGLNSKTVSQLALASCSLKEYILCFHNRLNLSSSTEFPTYFQISLVQRAHSKAESHSTGVSTGCRLQERQKTALQKENTGFLENFKLKTMYAREKSSMHGMFCKGGELNDIRLGNKRKSMPVNWK